jgi:hypothetical protein
MSDHDDVVARAARELREDPETGWDDLAGSLLAAVRSTTRRTVGVRARPAGDDEAAGHRLTVTDAVVVRLAARGLEAVPGVAPARVRLRLDERVCRGAQVHLVARYGTDLDAAAEQVRDVVGAVLDDLLGPVPPGEPARVVDVVVDDVVPDDRNL